MPDTSQSKFVQVITDYENNADGFWDDVHKLQAEGNELAKLLEPDDIVVTDEEATQIKELVEGLDGWHDPQAAEFAPHPLIFQDYEKDFREEGYDSFSTEEGPEPSDSYRPSEYGDFPKMSDAAKEIARDLYDEGFAQNQTEFRDRCESLDYAIRDLFESADGEPLRGESNAIMRCTLTDKVYSVQVTRYFPAVSLDWRRLWDGADEGEQNPDDDDGTLESDLQSFADDSANSDKSRDAVRVILAKLRAIESHYTETPYQDSVTPETVPAQSPH